MNLFIALLIIISSFVLFLKLIHLLLGAFTIGLIYPKTEVDNFLDRDDYSYVSHQNISRRNAFKEFDLSFISTADKIFFRIFYYKLVIKTNKNESEELLVICLKTFSFFVKGRLIILRNNKIILDKDD